MTTSSPAPAVTIFRGRVGDHNDLAMSGSRIVGDELAARLGVAPVTVGTPRPALNTGWERELTAGHDDLRAIAEHLDGLLAAGLAPISAITRCSVALGTVPVVARHRPGTCVLWLDAHADLQRPDTTSSGFLGGMALSGPLGWWDSGHGAGVAVFDVVLTGARDIDPVERDLIAEHGVRTVACGPGLAERLGEAIAGRPVYVHLDCDVLDPGIVPTDYEVPDGLTLDDLHACATAAAHSEVVGLQVAEFQDDEREPSPVPLVDALAPLWEAAARGRP